MTTTKTADCPVCGKFITFEVCELLPTVIPAHDWCADAKRAELNAARDAENWQATLNRMPDAYRAAKVANINSEFSPIMEWNPEISHPGGVGLVAKSGKGKSCALACLVARRRQSFLWWSGTEARDAHLEANTADKDRDGARRRWNHGAVVPVLVLDDISQGKMTETWSAALFDLLEDRSSRNLPTLWTCQIGLTAFRQKIVRQNGGDNEQAQAITQRLARNTLIINTLPKPLFP